MFLQLLLVHPEEFAFPVYRRRANPVKPDPALPNLPAAILNF
jgi:hypothetical protein